MILNRHELDPNAALEGDICVIGAGAAGIAFALQFENTPTRVIVLEGGGRSRSGQPSDFFQIRMDGQRHTGAGASRERLLGGMTTTWGGQALPFAAHDFRKRDWLPHSGWPVGRDELMPFYARAEEAMTLDRSIEHETDLWSRSGLSKPAFDPQAFELFVTKWSPRPNFATTYGPRLQAASNIRVVLDATARRIRLSDQASQVQAVEAVSAGGTTLTVRAREVVLACGAIETARLLLASNDVEPHGVGNRRDLVGRFFQDHCAARIGLLIPADRAAFHDVFDTFYVRRLKYMPRLRLAPPLMERERILGASGQIFFSDPGGTAIHAAKRLASHLMGRHRDASLPATIRQAASAAPEVCAMAARLVLKSRGRAPRHPPIWLECHAEQAPDPDSRVFLTDERDALGLPRAALDWRVSDLTRRTMQVFAERAGAEFRRLGLGELIADDWLHREDSDWRGQIGDTIHQMGGARMADDPARGVVDRNCQVHGIGNLSIASSAVFPTGSFSNPTLTILALAIRLADHLKQKASR